MSESARPVTEEHFRYIADRAEGDDDFLRELKAAAETAGIPRIWISAEQAAFFGVMLKATGARQVVEVGTLAGYAAIRMARALGPDGRVRTVEVDPMHAQFARDWIAKSDVADRVEVLEGDATSVLAGMADGSADAAFVDADKENYPVYLRECLRVVRLGGTILVDNAFAFGQLFDAKAGSDVQAIRAFNDTIAATPELQSVLVPFGDGCWMGVKVSEPAPL